jgi:cullin 1
MSIQAELSCYSQTMKNQVLIQEVTSQISTRFAPRIPDIKKVFAIILAVHLLINPVRVHQAIDTLLEKEYIERVRTL